MNRIWIGLAVLTLGAGAAKAQEEDLIGSKKAPSILPKAVKAVMKKEGFRFLQKISITGLDDRKADFRGETRNRKAFAAATGSAEVYAKGLRYLVRSGENFFPPDKLKGEEGTRAAMFRNPAVLLLDIRKLSRGATWGDDETVDGKACIVAKLSADERTVKAQIKGFNTYLGELKQYGVSDITPYIDVKRSTSRYLVSVGKEDLLIHRIEWVVSLAVKKNAIPPGVPITLPEKVEAKMEMKMSGYDEELQLDLPKKIRQWSGIKG